MNLTPNEKHEILSKLDDRDKLLFRQYCNGWMPYNKWCEWYIQYRNTVHWQRIRAECAIRAKGKCKICSSKRIPLDTHHNSYKNLWREEPSDVVYLCKKCHKLFEGILTKKDIDNSLLKEQIVNFSQEIAIKMGENVKNALDVYMEWAIAVHTIAVEEDIKVEYTDEIFTFKIDMDKREILSILNFMEEYHPDKKFVNGLKNRMIHFIKSGGFAKQKRKLSG